MVGERLRGQGNVGGKALLTLARGLNVHPADLLAGVSDPR
jgi:hypothetical protein